MLPNSTVLLVYLLAVHILVGAVIGVLGGLGLQLLDGISLRFCKDTISGGGGFVIGSIVGPVASSRLSSWNYFQLRRGQAGAGCDRVFKPQLERLRKSLRKKLKLFEPI